MQGRGSTSPVGAVPAAPHTHTHTHTHCLASLALCGLCGLCQVLARALCQGAAGGLGGLVEGAALCAAGAALRLRGLEVARHQGIQQRQQALQAGVAGHGRQEGEGGVAARRSGSSGWGSAGWGSLLATRSSAGPLASRLPCSRRGRIDKHVERKRGGARRSSKECAGGAAHPTPPPPPGFLGIVLVSTSYSLLTAAALLA
jgi:hypothetical protein